MSELQHLADLKTGTEASLAYSRRFGRTLVIYKGLPGSGKSTLASNLVAEDPGRWFRINRDDLRMMVSGYGNDPHKYYAPKEKLIRAIKESMIIQAWDAGFDVIVDDTHLIKDVVKKLHKVAADYDADVRVKEIGVNTPLETCLERNALRQGFARVPDSVILDMAKKAGITLGHQLESKETDYPAPHKPQPVNEHDLGQGDAIICDLDGTLAIIGDRSPYDAKDCDLKDKPNPPIVDICDTFARNGSQLIFMSGRDSKYRPETERFIEKCLGSREHRPYTYQLYMRAEGDTRKDSIVKEELFNQHVRGKYYVEFVLDDRDQVVKLWRDMGLTCLQCNYGDF